MFQLSGEPGDELNVKKIEDMALSMVKDEQKKKDFIEFVIICAKCKKTTY